ncbi:hypothetical protein HDV04_001726 [Boothiomyces sp. JEL0838]|nr:hypothetical protein HDV04_001726 [Boothiomyces sp. JEL0838]
MEEIKQGEQRIEYKDKRKENRAYYYIDYELAVNVIKFKTYRIGKMLENQVKQNINQLMYKAFDI